MDPKPVRENGDENLRDQIDLKANTEPDVVFFISPETGCRLTHQGLQEQSHLLSDQLRQASSLATQQAGAADSKKLDRPPRVQNRAGKHAEALNRQLQKRART